MRQKWAVLSALLFVCAPLFAADKHFRILQVNDVYKIEGLENGAVGGLARVRTLRKQLEADGTPVLLLHAGDAIFPSVMSKYLAAQPMIRVLNLLDGDAAAFDGKMAAAIGNHELENADPIYTLGRLTQSDFTWLACNIWYCAGGTCSEPFSKRIHNVADVMTFDVGVPVAVIGLTTDSGTADYFKVDFNDRQRRIADVREAVEAVSRDKPPRLLIGLTHEDWSDDELLAKSVGFALIAGGHDHLYGERDVNGCHIAKGDADARSVVVWDVTVPPAGPPKIATKRVFLDETIAKDPLVDAEVQKWTAELTKKLGPNDTIGFTKNKLEGVEPAVRGYETALGNLLADVARGWMHADVGLMNGGGIRINDNIPPGPVRKYDMEGIFYYSNTLVDFAVTGQQLLDILNNSVSHVDAGDGRFLQVSGVKFTYRGGPPFTVAAKDVAVNGKPLDLGATYTVGTIDYIYDRGASIGYALFDPKNPSKPKLLHPLDTAKNDFRKATEATIAALPGTMITTAVEGRIVAGK
ncbi:MAG TPA: bifunctional UDP-sugar hydrolase/5'-nucleotidase [Thermoanaerobaculia bacterium]|jgi:5'-nucleotidase